MGLIATAPLCALDLMAPSPRVVFVYGVCARVYIYVYVCVLGGSQVADGALVLTRQPPNGPPNTTSIAGKPPIRTTTRIVVVVE